MIKHSCTQYLRKEQLIESGRLAGTRIRYPKDFHICSPQRVINFSCSPDCWHRFVRAGAAAGTVVVVAGKEAEGKGSEEMPDAEVFKGMVGFPSGEVVKQNCRAVLIVSRTPADINMTLR